MANANAQYPAESFQEIHFPKAGIDVSQAFLSQPARPVWTGPDGKPLYARTCPVGQNVRGWEPLSGRERGGSRPGQSKYLPVQLLTAGLADFVQELNTFTVDHATGGDMQTSQSGRVVTLVAVSQGNVFVANPGDTAWTSPTNNTSFDPPLNAAGLVYSAANNQKLYFADGSNWCFYDSTNSSITTWAASAGALPVDFLGNTPRLICNWRGRIVLSGLMFDPANWFMSAVDDPTNFDYSPQSITPTQAVAGNNAPAGLIGDMVTALIPYTDDVLVFGGDHTIYMMRGDPMAGGQIDLISDAIGIAWGKAFTRDPYGNIYFMSNRCGIYSLVPGNQPQRISQQIEQLLLNIDMGANGIRLIWNDRFQGLNVFVTPLAGPGVTTHFFWEARSGAWWTDTFASTSLDPLCCTTFDGNDPGDRVPLVGSWDGYVRAIDPTATSDDGQPINSRVVIGPFDTQDFDDVLFKDLQGILGETSGQVTYKIYSGHTPEAALASTTPTATGTWSSGRNLTNFVRRAAHAHYIDLSSSVPWAMEAIRARVATLGKVRRRGK